MLNCSFVFILHSTCCTTAHVRDERLDLCVGVLTFLRCSFWSFVSSSSTISSFEKIARKKKSLKMKFYILASFVIVAIINNPLAVKAQDDSPQNINKLLNNQMIVSR